MKKMLLVVLALLLVVCSAYAQDEQKQLLTIEGKIVVEQSSDGKEVVKIKSGLVDLLIVANAVLEELLKIEKLEEKTVSLEGEKGLNEEGTVETFTISRFQIVETVEHDDHEGHNHHDHGSHEGHNH